MTPAYDAAELKRQLEQSAHDLKTLLTKLPNHDAITDVFDYIVGAQYGLVKAIEIGFVDRPGIWHSTYRPHLLHYVEHISVQKAVNKRWLAGFYFNSGIQRLAACFDRIPKLLGAKGKTAPKRMKNINAKKYGEWKKVYEEINAFKHDVSGRAKGRLVSMTEAVQAFEQAAALLVTNEAKIAATYR